MRTYILTPTDREIIKRYLENGAKKDGFRDLKWRVKNSLNLETLKDDLKLLRDFKESMS